MSKPFLCLDLGAGSVKAAEFQINPTGNLTLKQYALTPLGVEGTQESKRERVIQSTVQELLKTPGFTAKRASLCAAGFQTYSKIIKLPPVDSAKVAQIIQYEAQQNIPYPLPEAVWDYQILGATPTGELEILLVAIKADAVEGHFRVAEAAGLKLELVDASPAALCNAFRYNYGEPEACCLLLDIGAKTTNVLIFEKGKIFTRTINIGANAITQDFVAEAKIPFAKAEQIKIDEGFVSLGGAFEDPEHPHQAAVSKIARQVLTRLHIQINQTIQFYRGQQGGSAPQRLYLAGGASIMPYTAQFFAEKLNIAVEYFNPFRNVTIEPGIDLEELAKVAHGLGEVVGLALRNLAQCPVEMNLIPKSIRAKQAFDQKKPYFIASIVSVAAVIFAVGLFYNHTTSIKRQALADLNKQLHPLQARADEFAKYQKQIQHATDEVNVMTTSLKDRFFWPEALVHMRSLLLTVEDKLAKPGQDAGVWIENFGAVEEALEDEPQTRPSGPVMGTLEWFQKNPELGKKYFPQMYEMLRAKGLLNAVDQPFLVVKPKTASTNLVTINVRFRAVNLNKPEDPAANGRLTYAVADAFKSSELFDTEGTRLNGDMEEPESEGPNASTFRFNMILKLRDEIKM